MSNVNVGDLAMVVRQVGDCPSGCYMSTVVTPKMPLFTERGLVWIVAEQARCIKSRGGWCRRNDFPDACLMRIRGDEGGHPGDVTVNPAQKEIDEFDRSLRELERQLDALPK